MTYAPSKEKRTEALNASKKPVFYARVWIAVLLAFRFVFSWVLYGLHLVQKGGHRGNYYSYSTVVSFATGIFFLSLLIALRYVGVFAIAQCSTYPLPFNPYNRIIYTLKSFNRILESLLTPDTIKEQNSASQSGLFSRSGTTVKGPSHRNNSHDTHGPLRYKDPTLFKCMIQIIVHAFFGALFYQSTLDPILKDKYNYNGNGFTWYNQEYLMQKTFLMFCCILMSCFTFVTTYLSDSYHELSPSISDLPRHCSLSDLTSKVSKLLMAQIQSCGFLFYWCILPILSMFVCGLFQWQGVSNFSLLVQYIQGLLIAYPTTLLIAMYIMAMDIVVRIGLLQPGLNVETLVLQGLDRTNIVSSVTANRNSASNDYEGESRTISVEDVIVEILLGGMGTQLLDYVTAPRLIVEKNGYVTILDAAKLKEVLNSAPSIDLGEEENRRNAALISAVADLIERGFVAGHANLEDDLLKLAVLEAFGGPNLYQETGYPLGLSSRHYKFLVRRLGGITRRRKGTNEQSISVPILRAICLYLSATGTALSSQRSASNYSISPCTLLSLRFAVNAATRLIVLNMTFRDENGNYQGKRLNRMSLLLSTVIESIYKIRSGTLEYCRQMYESNNIRSHRADIPAHQIQKQGARAYQAAESFESFLAVKHMEVAKLVNTCDDCASLIVQEIKKVDGSCDFGLKIHPLCKEWFQTVNA